MGANKERVERSRRQAAEMLAHAIEVLERLIDQNRRLATSSNASRAAVARQRVQEGEAELVVMRESLTHLRRAAR